jgi:hypothetical protein
MPKRKNVSWRRMEQQIGIKTKKLAVIENNKVK